MARRNIALKKRGKRPLLINLWLRIRNRRYIRLLKFTRLMESFSDISPRSTAVQTAQTVRPAGAPPEAK
jgi:hypothetical protein